MGTDIYKFLILKIQGNTVTIKFWSGQDSGLYGSNSKMYWCSWLQEYQDGNEILKYFIDNPLPLELNPNIQILNVSQEVDFDKVIDSYGQWSCKGSTGSGDEKSYDVNYRDYKSAEKMIQELHGQNQYAIQGKTLEVAQVPLEFISPYDMKEQQFDHFITKIENLGIDFKNRQYTKEEYQNNGEQCYWNTQAKFSVTFSQQKYLCHLSEGQVIYGR